VWDLHIIHGIGPLGAHRPRLIVCHDHVNGLVIDGLYSPMCEYANHIGGRVARRGDRPGPACEHVDDANDVLVAALTFRIAHFEINLNEFQRLGGFGYHEL
jgi:hypothetical protein